MRISQLCSPRLPLFAAMLLVAIGASALRAEALESGIVNGSGMRLKGNHTFVFNPSASAGPVTWSLDRETISSTGVHVRTNGVASRTGSTATFTLSDTSGFETLYYLNAADAGTQDVDTVQVFTANIRTWFTYRSAGNPDVRVYTVVPSSLSPATRVLLAMHGSSRTASSYADTWRSWASAHDYIVLCPYYDLVNWPTDGMYQLGNVFVGDDCVGTKNPEERWTFTIDLGIHNQVREGFGLADPRFDMWGFSGGGQHVHRFMLFKPNAPVRLAISAGSGWYTVPDDAIDCPYGPDDPQLEFAHQDVMGWTNRELVIMVGTADTLRDEELRVSPRADAQGRNRYERAGYMMSKAVAFNPLSRWRRLDVLDAPHESKPMAAAAQSVLLAAMVEVPHPPGNRAPRITPVLRIHPNPIAGSTELSGEGWAGGEVKVEIFDLAGRKLATGTASSTDGKWRFAWSSLATQGRIAPGMYLVRARDAKQQAEHKVMLLK